MGYIGRHGIEALKKYKYSGVDRSYMAKYVFQPFWSRFVNIFPLWMPPNMITLTGFLFVVASAFLSYIYSPAFTSPSPKWVHFVHGLLLFLYQTFDAVDGKQARRTNSSSPLGELFDHGCDALSCAFETLAFGNSVMSGRHTIWFWIIATIPFYGATWEQEPSTHGLVNGQDSNEQVMRPTIPMPMSNAGCFGGGSIFQAMIRFSPALHSFMPDNAYGEMQAGYAVGSNGTSQGNSHDKDDKSVS
ncbi:hypothetical protein L7F22_047000 [Adiantum nelumboides]|nr:hypothetical protein [Adiantum nelumboides]